MTTPADLLAAVGRAIAGDATLDDRRAGRQACLTLAAALGEPGEPMTFSNTPPAPRTAPRVDPLDLLMARMRAFLTEQAQREKDDAAAAETEAQTATAPPAPAPPHAPPPRNAPTTASSRSSSPSLACHHPPRIPMVRPLPRRTA